MNSWEILVTIVATGFPVTPIYRFFSSQTLQVVSEPSSPVPMETSGCASDELCQAFSDVLLNIKDVDADDYDNPMLCSEYVKDIYKYLRQLEVSYYIFSPPSLKFICLLKSLCLNSCFYCIC